MQTYYRTGKEKQHSVLTKFELYLAWLKRRTKTAEEREFLGIPYDEKAKDLWADASICYMNVTIGIRI